MKIAFTVEIEVERMEGKFASKDELADQLQEAIEGADPGSLEGDEGGQYDVSVWEVRRDDEAEKPRRLAR